TLARSSPFARSPPPVPRIDFAALSASWCYVYVVGVVHRAAYQPRAAEPGGNCAFERLVPFSCKGPRLLSELRGPPHDRGRCAPRRRHPAACAGTPVGAEPAASAPLSPGMGPRLVPRRARGVHARPAVVSAKARAAPR